MPIYQYECSEHGEFDERAALRDYAAPSTCPVCGLCAQRIVSLPNIASMTSGEVRARDRNERSRHEPAVVMRAKTGAHSGSASRSESRSGGAGGRPWMMGHG